MPELQGRGRRGIADTKGHYGQNEFHSVDEYIATHPENVQLILQRVRSTIRKALPDAEEVISYQISAYKLGGRAVLYFAGWKQHYSLDPLTYQIVEVFKDDLAFYMSVRGRSVSPYRGPFL